MITTSSWASELTEKKKLLIYDRTATQYKGSLRFLNRKPGDRTNVMRLPEVYFIIF